MSIKPENKMMTQEIESTQPAPHADFGEHSTMGKLAKCMEPQAFTILIALVEWARLWDMLYNSNQQNVKAEWDDAVIRTLLTPFTGFGNNPRLWSVVAEKCTALVGREVPLWLGDPAYRKANSMVWCVLQSLAPSLAASSHGFNGQMEAVKVLSEGFTDHR